MVKRLIMNLLLLFILVGIVIGIIVLITPKDTHNYLATAIDKHRLLVETPSPRIILVGGSNLAFGLDCEKIGNQLGMPVINMGLHAGLGIKYMVNEIYAYIKEGDIIIIIPEYNYFDSTSPDSVPLEGRPLELGQVIKFCPQCVSGVRDPTQVGNVVAGILSTTENDIFGVFKYGERVDLYSRIYSRGGFNRFGDIAMHRGWQGSLSGLFPKFSVDTPNPAIEFLNSSQIQIKNKKVKALFMFPAIPDKQFRIAENDLLSFERLLKTELDIPILGTIQDFVFPENYFFDTVYHLNDVGRDYRTNRMTELVRAGLRQ